MICFSEVPKEYCGDFNKLVSLTSTYFPKLANQLFYINLQYQKNTTYVSQPATKEGFSLFHALLTNPMKSAH